MAIVLDTETTDLMMPDVADISSQPHIIEIAMAKLDAKYRIVDRYCKLVKPGVPLDEEKHKTITGLKNADLADSPIFLEIYGELTDFFLGERTLIAHNLSFDLGVLTVELKRIGKEFAFPYPPQGICTVERTQHILGRRMKLTELYEKTLKKKLKQTHRAMDDVEALVQIVKAMKL